MSVLLHHHPLAGLSTQLRLPVESHQPQAHDCAAGVGQLGRRTCSLLLGSVIGWLWAGLLPGLGPCWGQTSSQIWSGTGQIVSGHGQGATVQLIVEINNGRIRTRSGPALDAPFGGGPQTIPTGEGMWQLEPQGDLIYVTLHRDQQIIRYRLQPKTPATTPLPPATAPEFAPSRESLNRSSEGGRPDQPILPVVRELITRPRRAEP
jgi:hypothetical protein